MKYLNSRTYLSLNQLCWPHVWRNEASVTVQLPVLHKRFDLILSNGPPNILGMQHFKRGRGKRYQRLQPCTNLFLETSHSTKCLTSLSRRSTCWHLERPKKKLLLGVDVAVRKQLPFHMSAFSTCPPSGIQATFTRLSFLGWRVDLILSKSLESMC